MKTGLLLALLALNAVIYTGALVWRSPGCVRARSERAVVLWIYRHVDEILGARKYEKDRAATRRHLWAYWRFVPFLGKALLPLGPLLWPGPRPDGTVPWPPHRRRVKYVTKVEFGIWEDGQLRPVPDGVRLQPWHVHAVRLSWSSEGIANADRFLEALERGKAGLGAGSGSAGLAQALGLEWFDGLFDRQRDDAHHRVKLTRTYTQQVPDGRWEELTDGAR